MAASNAEAGAFDLQTCSSVERVDNGRRDTASSLKIDAMVAPCGSKIGSADVFTAARKADPDEKRTRQEGITTPLGMKLPAGATNTSPSATLVDETDKTVSSPGKSTQSVVATRRCVPISEVLAREVSVI